MQNLKLKAKAIIAVRQRKRKEQELIDKISSNLPKAEDIAKLVVIPAPVQQIVQVEKETDKWLSRENIERFVNKQLIRFYENTKQDTPIPEIQVIREEMDTSGYVTKEELQEWLKKIERAIGASGGGGSRLHQQIKKVSTDYTAKLDEHVVCINTTPISITLPKAVKDDRIQIKRKNAAVTVVGTIDGVANKVINIKGYSMKLAYDGTEWIEI